MSRDRSPPIHRSKATAADVVRSENGVDQVTPVAIFRHVVEEVGDGFTDVNVVAYEPGGVVVPTMVDGVGTGQAR